MYVFFFQELMWIDFQKSICINKLFRRMSIPPDSNLYRSPYLGSSLFAIVKITIVIFLFIKNISPSTSHNKKLLTCFHPSGILAKFFQKHSFPLQWRIFFMQKYPFIPARNFSFICSKIYTKIF